MLRTATMNTQLNLNVDRISTLETALPPLAEQSKIVAYIESQVGQVSQIQRRIESQIAKLREYRQTLISVAVTGQIDVTTEGQR